MFKRVASKELRLCVEDEVYSFHRLNDFEFALCGRTSVSSAKLNTLVSLSNEALLCEADGIRKVERRLSDTLAGCLKGINSVSSFVNELDPGTISQDQQWRSIFVGLKHTPERFEEYKKIALGNYREYLRARLSLVNSLYASRPRQNAGSAITNDELDTNTHLQNLGKSTLLMSNGGSCQHDIESSTYSRIPKGETVEITLKPNRSLGVLLANHLCHLVFRDKLVFVDDNGHETELHRGKNFVGRDVGNDIVIDSSNRDVSRKHLIVEADRDDLVRLTDISSHGTAVSPGP